MCAFFDQTWNPFFVGNNWLTFSTLHTLFYLSKTNILITEASYNVSRLGNEPP